MQLRFISFAVAAVIVAAAPKNNGFSAARRPGQVDMDMTLMHTRIGTPFNARAVAGLFKFESEVSDELTVGVRLATSGSLIKSAFARFDFGNGFTANLNSEGTSAVKGDLTWEDGSPFRGPRARSTARPVPPTLHKEGKTKVTMHLDSSSSAVVDRVSYFHSNRGWSINPSANLRSRRIDLAAAADCSPDTHLQVSVKGDGSSSVEVDHAIDAATSVKVKSNGVGVKRLSVEVTHHVDSRNSVRPCYDVASRSFMLSWVHKLDGYGFGGFGGGGRPPPQQQPYNRRSLSSPPSFQTDGFGGQQPSPPHRAATRNGQYSNAHYRSGRRVTVNVVPYYYASVELESDDAEDWVASLSAPWGDAKSATVSLSRNYPL